jgi:hypothetical protein
MMGTQEQKTQIEKASAEFPATFALRSCPNETFRISPYSSYVNDSGVVMLYTEILKDGNWLSYCKGSPSELRSAVLPFRAPAKVYCECKAVHGGNKHARTLQCDPAAPAKNTMCRYCRGKGEVDGHTCPECQGPGVVSPAPAKAKAKKARRFVVVEIVATKGQELMTMAAFVSKYGKRMAEQILSGFIGDTLAFRTVGCGCGEGNDLNLGHSEGCELRALQTRHDKPGRASDAAHQQARVVSGKRNDTRIRVRLTDADGAVYIWRVWRDAAQNGWSFEDHDGCERFAEGDWNALVEKFRLVASNYGFYTNLS